MNKEHRASPEAMLARRKKNFQVMASPVPYNVAVFPGELFLRVTHNGINWNGISLLPEEATAVIEKLREVIDENKNSGRHHANGTVGDAD